MSRPINATTVALDLHKRKTLKGLWQQLQRRQLADGSVTTANMFTGYMIRLDKGRYDDNLDALIAEARAELDA